MLTSEYISNLPAVKMQFERNSDEPKTTYERRVNKLKNHIDDLVKRSWAYEVVFMELVLGKPETPTKKALKIALDVLNTDTHNLRIKLKINVNVSGPKTRDFLDLDKRLNYVNDNLSR